ncbi:MAG: bifunctional tetrahydrofolate synthase/dihydrofolate synthase [Xanthomonadales bacterium]|nr:bifunctional tetrahydrofolate synthase/dihydrofolate synthase [Xanthomonadales bacterium]
MPESSPLADWLDYQQRIHPHAIELGLDRVREVWSRLGAPAPAPLVITVGGTNGKGSTVALLEAMLAAAGKRVGAYTSPHLVRYNERVRVGGREVDDAALVEAFERVEAARMGQGAPVALTYFEYGTLAALWIFAHAGLDIAVLEVGLGGRLDAVNIIDADAAIVTTVDLDHQDFLGNDRDTIGREKAGIFRHGRPAIIGDPAAPSGLLDAAGQAGADLRLAGREFRWTPPHAGHWHWSDGMLDLDFALPHLAAPCQLANAAAALAALAALRPRLEWNPRAIAEGLAAARLPARLQRFAGPPELVIDVAHNPQAAGVLAEWLAANPAAGRTLAVFGALGDKDVAGVAAQLAPRIDGWFLGGLDGDSPRGLGVAALAARITDVLPGGTEVRIAADMQAALASAFTAARAGDRIVAFGSFFVAAAALDFAASRGLAEAAPATGRPPP